METGPGIVHYLPIATTLLAAPFAVALFRRYAERPQALHLLWWAIGVTAYGLGTALESAVTLFGWSPFLFRSWYVAGALLGGAPLAQGTVYLLMSRRIAHVLTGILLTVVAVAAVCVWLSPIDTTLVESHRLTGRVMEWTWVRRFSPFINIYAFLFLVGGAVWSAFKYAGKPATRHRAVGNALIAVGALLPGIGGTATRMGHTEVLYVTELVGLALIWLGYRTVVRGPREPRTAPPAGVAHAAPS